MSARETPCPVHNDRPKMWGASHRPPEAKVRKVVEVQFTRGEGCCGNDVVRLGRAFYDLDGTLIGIIDDWEPERPCYECGETVEDPKDGQVHGRARLGASSLHS